jgi:phasin family protein
MMTIGAHMALQACKQQLECAATVIEAMTEGSMRLRETQLKAAREANAGMKAQRERIAGAGDAQELWRIQSEWAQASFGAALTYWRSLAEIALATQSLVAKCVSRQPLPSSAQAAPGAEDPQRQIVEVMDSAYRRWLESTRQFYAPPVIAAPQIRQPA